MSSKGPDPTPRPSGLQAMLARLRGMAESLRADPREEDPQRDGPPVAAPAPVVPVASAGTPAQPGAPANAPQAVPVAEPAPASSVQEQAAPAPPAATVVVEAAPPEATPEAPPAAQPPAPQAAQPQLCPFCSAPRTGTQSYCDDCGWIFPLDSEPSATPAAPAAPTGGAVQETPTAASGRVKDRYEIQEQISERAGVARFRALDQGVGTGQPVPVILVRGPVPDPVEAVLPAAEVLPPVEDSDDNQGDDILPSFDEAQPAAAPMVEAVEGQPAWPGVSWERSVLENARHPSLPGVLDSFAEGPWEYLVEEVPTGQVLWEAWDDPDAGSERRFGWLKQVAEGLQQLHRAGALLETLRPDTIVITDQGQARLTDLSDLLPLPLPSDAPIRGTLYTAPELTLSREQADARANLYSFGGLLYSLYVGRELTEMDFERQGVPKPFIPRFPDVHPLLGRLVAKTFCRNVDDRFPSDEAVKEDPSGFTELMRVMDVCGRTLDNVRLEIAAWTTTGIVRTGNEDAFGLLHSIESRQDDLGESALVLLADGMGGYEAGEVAAAMAIQALKKNLVQQKPFAALGGGTAFSGDLTHHDGSKVEFPTIETCKQLLLAALKDTNKQIYTASRTGVGRRGMGCTAEVVYINGRNVVVGHVGDSRTYHLHQGRMIQITRDQTLVNRLVELGTLSPEEAEHHPRRSELQQALGGHADVEPALYHGSLKAGDWVVVCSDGISNHIGGEELKQMLQGEATSAEMAARRLVNFVNIRGATDNATLVVIRAT